MKKFIVLLFALIWPSAFAADSQITGTITFSGIFAPVGITIQYAVNDCGAGVDFATCKASLDAASFSGHSSAATANLGNIAANGGESRFVQFEMLATFVTFKNDFVQYISALTSSTNDIDVVLRRLTFVSVGSGIFGQTTLGNPGSADLSANEAMIDDGDEVTLGGSLTAVWDQSVDNPAAVNNKVILALAGNRLVLRGIYEVKYGEDATSDAYSAVVTNGLILKDN